MEEIVIRLNPRHLKKTGYIAILVILSILLIIQHFYPNCALDDIEENSTEETNSMQSVTIIKADSETTETENTSETEEEEETNTTEEDIEEEDDEDLPITGEITFTIDKIYIDPKESIDDYAKVTSVKFTIKNQKADFIPKVKGYLTAYKDEDVKIATLAELEAGKFITETSTRLNFGYNNIDEEQELILKLYDERNKFLETASKTFDTE